MGLKSFILGAATVYGIQYITKKREDGSSILSDFMDNPPDFVNQAKEYATSKVDEVIETATSKIKL